jgi:hypothetical protein
LTTHKTIIDLQPDEPPLSIVVPVYNEEEVLTEFHETVVTARPVIGSAAFRRLCGFAA